MKSLLITLLSVLAVAIASSAIAQEPASRSNASGYVYHDANGNGRRDAGETGLEGVAVSNGRDVVLTDSEGCYTLPVGSDVTIFVIKPSGYATPLSEEFTPLYYYTHKPDGSIRGLKYPAFAPTGALPNEISFPLRKITEPFDYSVLLFGDPQPHSEQDLSYFAGKVVPDAIKRMPEDVLFGVSLGDLVWDKLELEPLYKQEMTALKLPWYNVMGNHDMNVDPFITDDSDSDETFEYYFGPANYAFNYGDVHYIILDDILFPDPSRRSKYLGGYRPDQLDFLENDLKQVDPDRLVVLMQHIQLTDKDGLNNHFRMTDRERLFRILSNHDHVLILSAHTHTQSFFEYAGTEYGREGKEPILEYNVGTTCGDWFSGKICEDGFPEATMRDGTPQGFAILHISGNQYYPEYRVLEKPDDYRMIVTAPKVVAAEEKTTANIVANIFMCAEGDQVEYRIGDGEWRPMTFDPMAIDPSYRELLREWDVAESLPAGRRPSNPIRSTHHWVGSIDRTLTTGSYEVQVRAKDRFGQVHEGSTTLLVEQKD